MTTDLGNTSPNSPAEDPTPVFHATPVNDLNAAYDAIPAEQVSEEGQEKKTTSISIDDFFPYRKMFTAAVEKLCNYHPLGVYYYVRILQSV